MNWKKYIIGGGLLLIGTLCATAQPRLRTPEYYVGVHGGVTASSIIYQPAVTHMTPITQACVLGGNGGLVFRYMGHKYCAFQMELNYEHRGWAEYDASVGRYTRNMHYLELPILMHLHFGKRICHWFFNLGPQIGYCLKDEGNQGILVNGNTAPQYKPVDHPFDWGLTAGTGLSFYTPHAGVFELEVRFDYSFGGIFGTGVTDHFNMASPMDLSINLAYLWGFRKANKRRITNDKNI